MGNGFLRHKRRRVSILVADTDHSRIFAAAKIDDPSGSLLPLIASAGTPGNNEPCRHRRPHRPDGCISPSPRKPGLPSAPLRRLPLLRRHDAGVSAETIRRNIRQWLDRKPMSQGLSIRRRAPIMRHWRAVRPKKTPTYAPPIRAKLRLATHQLNRHLIAECDPAFSVGCVDRRRQCLQ
jgi:hypothetical protein